MSETKYCVKGCYFHVHLDPKCPSFQNMVKKFTKDGKSCQDAAEKFEDRMVMLKKNFPDLVKYHKVVYECKFKEFLAGKISPDFDSTFDIDDLNKKQQFFSRLIPRAACLPGKKVLLHLCWSKIDSPNQKFYYWDMNMAYTYALKKYR